MAIIRTKQVRNFTTLDNGIFATGGLAWDSRGLLCTLLSKPDDWQVIVKALEKETEGTRKHTRERGIWEMFKELIAAGYVVRKKRQSGEVDYYVFDTPQTAETADCGNSSLRKPQTAETADCGNSSLRKPQTAETADCGNVGELINTDNYNKELKKDNKELNGNGGADAPPAAPPAVVNPPDAKPKSAKRPKGEPDPDNVRTWQAYARAYRDRYGVLPATNAKTRGQTAQFVGLVGREVAPELAAFFVWHNEGWFVRSRHDFGCLLKAYQQVLTDMQRGEQMTATKARQTERTQANFESHKGALEILKAKGVI
ncbi:hypothetical protein [Neisseria shayeganii]|uniref:Uncharacterized protein n=1 Tax=Neisseria shayeganii 871 TaxID=1032488 RepID=G4CG75_9NEIS|nr:hypothetical protein [Neisseria shayeganii]EGY53123.1 hypothetical protein HMPREF9371_0614 [Neisseria shayeganii 871]